MSCVRVMGGDEVAHSEISAMTFYEAWRILVTGGWKDSCTTFQAGYLENIWNFKFKNFRQIFGRAR
jgi:hypothetical protein